MVKGHRIFELNLETRIINEIKVEKGDKGKEGFLYCTALNAKNADKRFHKMLKLKYPKK